MFVSIIVFVYIIIHTCMQIFTITIFLHIFHPAQFSVFWFNTSKRLETDSWWNRDKPFLPDQGQHGVNLLKAIHSASPQSTQLWMGILPSAVRGYVECLNVASYRQLFCNALKCVLKWLQSVFGLLGRFIEVKSWVSPWRRLDLNQF